MTATPNQALQGTRLRVTAPASATAFPPTMQVPPRSDVSLSLQSLGRQNNHSPHTMKYLLAILLAVFCCCQSFALTADQLAQFQSITWWESEVALPPGSFNIEVLEFSDGKMSKAVTEVFAGPAGADQVPSTTGNTPILVMWKPSDHGLFLTVTMGGDTRPGTPGACQNFNGPSSFSSGPHNASGAMKSIKEGDYILGGEPLIQDGGAHVTDDIKDYKRVLVLRVSKKA